MKEVYKYVVGCFDKIGNYYHIEEFNILPDNLFCSGKINGPTEIITFSLLFRIQHPYPLDRGLG